MPVHPELNEEQEYIETAYQRLDAMRAAVHARLADALATSRPGTHQAVDEREVIVRTSITRLEQLDLGPEALCFGRIDFDTDPEHLGGEGLTAVSQVQPGDRFYIGRLAVSGAEQDPLVVDWRAPVAEPFYRATGRHPLGLALRRHFLTEGRQLLGIEDERFAGGEAGDELGLAGSTALVAALERSRTGRMRDIVATVQREQDEVIRGPLAGTIVVQGGPGTGKTAVALHRAAYLLYTHRFPLERQGVLVVGPNQLFLRYIEHVLPSLGESGVSLSTVDGLGDTRAKGRDTTGAARIKGQAVMARVIARAVRDRERPLGRPLPIAFGAHTLTLTPEMTADAVDIVKRRGGTHNGRRRQLEAQIWRRLHQQYIAAADRARRVGFGGAAEDLGVEEVGQRLRRDVSVMTALDRVWPVLTPQELLHDLFGAKALLRLAVRNVLGEVDEAALFRPRSESVDDVAWTSADLPLLDEAAVILGPVRKGDDEPVRAYGHIVLDEAQDLTAMQLRMIARRSISGSMTVVGDIGQSTGHVAPRSWDDITRHLPDAPTTLVELTVNYRTPAEIMELAGRVLAEAAPDLRPPDSVRSTGVPPEFRAASPGHLGQEVARAAAEGLASGDGTVGIVCPASAAGALADALTAAGVAFGEPTRHGLDQPITLVPMELAKGLEFDTVVVVEPARIVVESPQGLRALYVALTRATKRLVVLYAQPLPDALT